MYEIMDSTPTTVSMIKFMSVMVWPQLIGIAIIVCTVCKMSIKSVGIEH